MNQVLIVAGIISVTLSAWLIQSYGHHYIELAGFMGYIGVPLGIILIISGLFWPWLKRKYLQSDHTPELRNKAKHEYSEKYR